MLARHPIRSFTLGAAIPSGVKCAKSVVLPPDFLSSTSSRPLVSAGPTPSAPSETAATISPLWLIGGTLALVAVGATVLGSKATSLRSNPSANPDPAARRFPAHAHVTDATPPAGLGPHGLRAWKILRDAYNRFIMGIWSRKPGRHDDVNFYAPNFWATQESVLRDALLVVTFEGDDAREFFRDSNRAQKALEKHGYFLEYGHSWSAGVYVIG